MEIINEKGINQGDIIKHLLLFEKIKKFKIQDNFDIIKIENTGVFIST
nr:hypothetical protein [Elizabethkingia sp. ASV34]